MSEKSVFGIDENVVAALSNGTFGIFGICAYVMEHENKFVRFHGMQSLLTFGALSILGWTVSFIGKMFAVIPILGWILAMVLGIASTVIGIVTVVAWVYLTYSSFKGQMFKVPVIGDIVWKQIDK